MNALLAVVPWYYRALALLAVAAVLFGWGYIEGGIGPRKELAVFTARVAAAGQAQAKMTAMITDQDKRRKENADKEHDRQHTADVNTILRLRNERAGGSFVPPAPAGSAEPARASFDRAGLERAIRELDTGVQGLVDKGTAAVTDLNVDKRWAQDGD